MRSREKQCHQLDILVDRNVTNKKCTENNHPIINKSLLNKYVFNLMHKCTQYLQSWMFHVDSSGIESGKDREEVANSDSKKRRARRTTRERERSKDGQMV